MELDISDIYDAFTRGSVSHDKQTFVVGTSTFSTIAARFLGIDHPNRTAPFADVMEFALIAEMSSRRFLSLATVNPFDSARNFGFLHTPTMYLFTDDDRRTCSVEAVGGIEDALRHRNANGSDAPLPVVLFIENNQELVRAADVDEALIAKINTGTFARFGSGDPKKYVAGASFPQIASPAGRFGADMTAMTAFR